MQIHRKSYACLGLLQRFIHRQLLFKWISMRALSMRHLQLDFDSWCQRYYQGTFSSVQAGSSVGILLQMLDGSLQQLKLQDAGFVVNQLFLDSLSASQHLQHLQLFGISSEVFVSDTLRALTQLVGLKNLELGNRGESQEQIQQQHPSFFPMQVCSLPNLVTLHIQSPLVTHIDSAISQLSHLRTLIMDGCSLHQVSSYLVQLSQLQTLCLADNEFLGMSKDHRGWGPEGVWGSAVKHQKDRVLLNTGS